MMADNIQDGLIIMENGKIIYGNNRIAEMTGYSLEELWAMEPLTIITPEFRDKAMQQFQDLQANPDKPGVLQTVDHPKGWGAAVYLCPYQRCPTPRYLPEFYHLHGYHGSQNPGSKDSRERTAFQDHG